MHPAAQGQCKFRLKRPQMSVLFLIVVGPAPNHAEKHKCHDRAQVLVVSSGLAQELKALGQNGMTARSCQKLSTHSHMT